MDFTFRYLQIFFKGVELASPLLLTTAVFIILLGLIVGARESWKWTDSIYWAFITATTVGYGDIRPTSNISKAISVLIALTGITITGILVALAINAASIAFKDLNDLDEVEVEMRQLLE
jgi:voltage-gated potassium channel